ncbi:HAMP domain-containing sensor histidine kinase [Microbispora bryophytorum subsp. camponoti]
MSEPRDASERRAPQSLPVSAESDAATTSPDVPAAAGGRAPAGRTPRMSTAMGTGPYRSQVPPPPSGPPAWDGPPPLVAHPVQRGNLLSEIKSLQNRISIRWRLTLTYAALVFVAGALLVMVMYVLLGQAIDIGWQSVPQIIFPRGSVPQEWIDEANHQFAQSQAEVTAVARAELLKRALLALLGVGILALMLGYVVADRALRPVIKMTATARKLSETSLAHERIDLQGPDDELKELADTFDAMLTRLNTAFDVQRRFVDNASHELRTPLAINRTVLEVALSDPEASDDLKVLGRTLLGTTARNERLIEGLLLLARSERELSVRKPLDVQEVARTAVEQLAPFAEDEGVTVEYDLHPAATTGDPVLIERCVSNLVENGIKHNLGESGKVWVRTGIVDGGAVVQVANTGPHVPAYEVEGLFEPFRRLNADRVQSAKGAGLGLSIVRAIVRAHGGKVAAVPRDGGGLVVTVRLSGAGASPGTPQSAR